jgi:hypothetical protein
MSIFKRSAGDAQQTGAARSADAGAHGDLPDESVKASTFAPAGAPPGVVPPPAAPMYSMRPPQMAARADGDVESSVAERTRIAREAQQNAKERVRLAVQQARTAVAPAPGVRNRTAQRTAPTASHAPPSRSQFDSAAQAQTGLLNLAWAWQEAGAPIRAIHTYVELLTRYPDTPAAGAAVSDLVELSEKLVGEGQFHTALAIYDQLERLV